VLWDGNVVSRAGERERRKRLQLVLKKGHWKSIKEGSWTVSAQTCSNSLGLDSVFQHHSHLPTHRCRLLSEATAMRSSVVHLIPIASLGQALGISLPPLIPAIPGVTEPLNQLAPPLPILQVPTPPLESPPFTASNIKPKKIGYFWTGAGDKQHKGAFSEHWPVFEAETC
jgi:hypothetical protein